MGRRNPLASDKFVERTFLICLQTPGVLGRKRLFICGRIDVLSSTSARVTMFTAILLMALAASMPMTNMNSVCQSAKDGALPDDKANAFQSCLNDETTARDELKRKWGHFSVLSRTTCAEPRAVTFSYVELLTCLEMQKGSDFSIPHTEVVPSASIAGTPIAK
jgi:hypothetical protein